MSIKVKIFASLAEKVGLRETTCQFQEDLTVGRVWELISDGSDMPQNVLTAVNYEYVKPDTVVSDGDEVGFFPPVSGG